MNRVWAYIISKPLSEEQLRQLQTAGSNFVSAWTAHENKLSAGFEIVKKRIIVVRVNEAVNTASGCSIDKLTRFIKEMESHFGIELLNRMLVAYQNGNDIEVIHAGNIKELLAQKLISENTIIYNTSVASENDLLHWEQPLKSTWLNRYLEKVQ